MRQSYPINHWFLTLLIAPFTSWLFAFLGKDPHKIVGLLEVYPLTLTFSLALSFPTLLIYLLFFYFLSRIQIHFIFSKALLIATALSGIIITTSLLGGSMMSGIAWTYSLTTILVGFTLNLKTKPINIPRRVKRYRNSQ